MSTRVRFANKSDDIVIDPTNDVAANRNVRVLEASPTSRTEMTAPPTHGRPESTPVNSSEVGGDHTHNVLDRLVRFYAFYAPELVPSAELTLRAYEGREDSLFRALQKKYGPESCVPKAEAVPVSSTKKRLTTTEGDSDSDREPVPEAPPPAPKFPPVHFDYLRLRLERYYELYAPDRIDNVTTAIASYQGRTEVMFRVLEKKYGPEPRAFVVIPRVASNVSAETGMGAAAWTDEEDHASSAAAIGTSQCVGPGAGPDPKSLPFHTAYDYAAVLSAIGIREAHLQQTLALYGDDRAAYAASVVLLLHLLSTATASPNPQSSPFGNSNSTCHDLLFEGGDPAADHRMLRFPFHRLAALKGCSPDAVDELAFTHIRRYRALFLTGIQWVMYIREVESVERKRLLRKFHRQASLIQRHTKLITLAISMLQPIEVERRDAILLDQRLRFDGLVVWFRQRRLEIVRGIPLVQKAYHLPQEDPLLDEEGDVFGAIASGRRLSESRSQSQFEKVQSEIQRSQEQCSKRCTEVVAKWSQGPSAAPASRTPSRQTNSIRTPSKLLSLDGEGRPTARSAVVRSHSADAKWVPSGVNTNSHHKCVRDVFPVENISSQMTTTPLKQVVIREIVQSDPFRKVPVTSLLGPFTNSSSNLLQRSKTPERAAASVQLCERTPPPYASLARASGAQSHNIVPCAVTRTVRLKSVAPMGSFSDSKFASSNAKAVAGR